MSNLPCKDFIENPLDGTLKDYTLVNLSTSGFYIHMFNMISGFVSLTAALILYKKASYDKI